MEPMDLQDSNAPDAPFESWNATQAYDFNHNFHDNVLATQVYLDDIDPCADTLQYDDASHDVCVEEERVQYDADPPDVELMATQAYGDDLETEAKEKAEPRQAEMPPPMVPKRKRTPELVQVMDQMVAVATPVRSPRRPVLDVLEVFDSPKASPPKRRRLYGKQPPPVPNPFVAPDLPAKQAKEKVTKAKRNSKKQKVYFAVTGFVLESSKREKLGKIPGVVVVDEWSSKVTHVIAKGFRRTTKLMCAVCAGLHIVVPEFLDECIREGEVVGEEPFLLKDEIAEATFAEKHELSTFSLQASVQCARTQPALLRSKSVYWADGSASEREELRLLVEAAGGRWLKRKPRKLRDLTAVPKSLWLGQDFDPELLREAACTQVLRWDTYRL